MAEFEKEITVKLKWELDEAKINFVNKGIRLKESFVLKDIYMVKDSVDLINTSNLDILSQVVIVRECIGDEIDKKFVCKTKKYASNGDILESKRCDCPLVDINKGHEFLLATGYQECFRIEQECLEYEYKGSKLFLEYIPDLGLFLEVENTNKDIEGLKDVLNELQIAYFEDNYFVKKASLMLDEVKRTGR